MDSTKIKQETFEKLSLSVLKKLEKLSYQYSDDHGENKMDLKRPLRVHHNYVCRIFQKLTEKNILTVPAIFKIYKFCWEIYRYRNI